MVSIGNITFACENPDRLADFWSAALGYVRDVPPQGLIEALRAEGREHELVDRAIVDPRGVGPRLLFNKRPKRPETPGTYIPIHLDLNAEDPDAEVRRLVELGATVVERLSDTVGGFSQSCTVLSRSRGKRLLRSIGCSTLRRTRRNGWAQ